MIEAKNASFAYEGVPAIENVSFTIGKGEFVAILGPNGSGKTTLVKLILGMLEPSGGSIELFGTPSNEFRDWKRVGYVPQRYNVDKQFPATVDELLRFKGSNNAHGKILGVQPLLHKKFSQLSGGQQQRVLIALALANDPEILVLDEPTVGVDSNAQEEFYALLKQLNAKGITIILVTHDVGLVSKHVKSVLVVNRNACFHGPGKQAERLLRKAYSSQFKVFKHAHGDHHD